MEETVVASASIAEKISHPNVSTGTPVTDYRCGIAQLRRVAAPFRRTAIQEFGRSSGKKNQAKTATRKSPTPHTAAQLDTEKPKEGAKIKKPSTATNKMKIGSAKIN